MIRFSSLAPPAALFFLAATFSIAQSTAPPAQSVSKPEETTASLSTEGTPEYFALEHRSAEQMDPADAELIRKQKRNLLAEAEFYGYDMSAGGWNYEQTVCPLVPDYVMLRYSNKDAAGAESLFTAWVPRNGGRIRIVPVLHHGATRFKPAPIDPRNFQLFSQIVPADTAAKNSGPEGKWLSLSVCYAEMTGARPQVPKDPSQNVHMIKAPPPTLRISVTGKNHEVSFVDPISPTDYRLWDISYNESGQIVSVSDDQHAFGEPVVKTIPEPTPKLMPQPPAPPVQEIPSSQQATPYPKTRPQPQ